MFGPRMPKGPERTPAPDNPPEPKPWLFWDDPQTPTEPKAPVDLKTPGDPTRLTDGPSAPVTPPSPLERIADSIVEQAVWVCAYAVMNIALPGSGDALRIGRRVGDVLDALQSLHKGEQAQVGIPLLHDETTGIGLAVTIRSGGGRGPSVASTASSPWATRRSPSPPPPPLPAAWPPRSAGRTGSWIFPPNPLPHDRSAGPTTSTKAPRHKTARPPATGPKPTARTARHNSTSP